MPARKLFNEAAFDAETTNAMGLAYDAVCLVLTDKAVVDSASLKENIANLIIR